MVQTYRFRRIIQIFNFPISPGLTFLALELHLHLKPTVFLHLSEVKKYIYTIFNLIIFNVFRDSCSNENYTNVLANAVKFGLERGKRFVKIGKKKKKIVGAGGK